MPEINFAIVDSNVLSCMGLRRLLEDIIPFANIRTFNSYEELVTNNPENFVHFFVASAIYFEHAQYFLTQPHRSIVLVHGESYPHLTKLLTLNVCQDEKAIVKNLLQLHNLGHSRSKINNENTTGNENEHPMNCPKHLCHNMQEMPEHAHHILKSTENALSAREIDVAILLAKGLINKEIADKLNISLTTVITHRKNIMDKLKARSLADIIIHVVMNGLVGVDEL